MGKVTFEIRDIAVVEQRGQQAHYYVSVCGQIAGTDRVELRKTFTGRKRGTMKMPETISIVLPKKVTFSRMKHGEIRNERN